MRRPGKLRLFQGHSRLTSPSERPPQPGERSRGEQVWNRWGGRETPVGLSVLNILRTQGSHGDWVLLLPPYSSMGLLRSSHVQTDVWLSGGNVFTSTHISDGQIRTLAVPLLGKFTICSASYIHRHSASVWILMDLSCRFYSSTCSYVVGIYCGKRTHPAADGLFLSLTQSHMVTATLTLY